VLEGDGKVTNGTLRVTSKNLAWGMRTLMADRNHWGSILEERPEGKSKCYALTLAINCKYARSIELDDRILKPIKSISSQLVDTTVYNIEVLEDNSYISDITMHNCELYITDDEDNLDKVDMNRDNYHLVALAMNEVGYQNLLRLVSNAHLKNFYYKPRITMQFLQDHSDGLIILSGCINNQCFRGGHYDPEHSTFSDPQGEAGKIIKWYHDVFGDRYYMEIQDHPDIPEQVAYNTWLIEQGKRLGIQLAITSDAHYLTPEDKSTHDILMAMQTKKTLEEYLSPENEFKFGEWNYVRSGEEMFQAAMKYKAPQAFENTLAIAERCNVELKIIGSGAEYLSPTFDINECEDKEEFEAWLRSQHA
jgi:DNA polymerase III alpha subunit